MIYFWYSYLLNIRPKREFSNVLLARCDHIPQLYGKLIPKIRLFEALPLFKECILVDSKGTAPHWRRSKITSCSVSVCQLHRLVSILLYLKWKAGLTYRTKHCSQKKIRRVFSCKQDLYVWLPTVILLSCRSLAVSDPRHRSMWNVISEEEKDEAEVKENTGKD